MQNKKHLHKIESAWKCAYILNFKDDKFPSYLRLMGHKITFKQLIETIIMLFIYYNKK